MVFDVMLLLGIFTLNIHNSHANLLEIKIKDLNDSSIKDNQLTNGSKRFTGPEVIMRAENGDNDGLLGIEKLHVTVLCKTCSDEQLVMKEFMNSMIAAVVTFTDGFTHSKTRPVEIQHRSNTTTIYEIHVSDAISTVVDLFSNKFVRKFIDSISRQAARVFRAME